MAVNIFELARQFGGVLEEPKDQTIDPAELAKQFGGEVVQPVEEPPKEEIAPVRPAAAPSPIGFGPLGLLTESIRSMKAGAEGQQTVNPILGATARGAELTGSALETTARLGQMAPQTLTATGPAISAIKSISPQLQQWADSFRNWGKEINYAPTTQLGELSDNPAKVVPFVLERVITSSPDMLAAYAALPAYIPTRANEILNERLKNDGRSLNEATIGDVAASAAAATVEGTLERFATRQLGATEGILRPTVLQAGTEAVEEVGAYAGETAGTKAGFDPTQAGLIAAEAAIVGGGLGGTIATGTELVRRNIESRVRDLEGVGTDIEQRELQKLRDQAFKDAQTITAPELPEATPVQYGDAYAQRIYDSVGQYIPANAEFKVEEKVVDGTPRFVVTDTSGTQYGQTLQDKAQADAFALSLNNTTKSRAELLKQLEPLETSLKDTIKGFGLNDVGLTLSNRVFTRRGEALTSEGLFDPVVRRVFLAVDAIDPQGNLDTTQRREALRGVLRHEVVHALRYLDLWKRSEWKNLEQTVGKVIKPGTDKTYLEIAKEAYGDQSPVIQVEEGVADLIRDVAGNLSRVAGKPRSLSERAINFFDKAKNALTGAGFQTYEDIVQRFEQGDIGARQRGRIRTFRATEEQQAARGEVPERLQRLFTNPQERNQFRQEVAQRVETQVPVATAPARNSLRLNAVRESRSTIDPVPPKITVGEREVPTRDSEGRLIYSGYEGPEVFGIQTRPTQEGISNFWNWFKDSKAVDKDKRPLVYYHGTAADITQFRPKQAGSVFITRSPEFSELFAGYSSNYMIVNFPDFMNDQEILNVLTESLSSPTTPKFYDKLENVQKRVAARVQAGQPIDARSLKDIKDLYGDKTGGLSSKMVESIRRRLPSSSNIMPVYVKADNPWDYENKEHVRALLKEVRKQYGADLDVSQLDIDNIRDGDWVTIEGSPGNSPFLDGIRNLGFDSMFVKEAGTKNLAVFDPNQIKSAVGNNGDFSPITPSIRESRKPVYNIINSRTGEVVGQANTIGGARRSVDRRDNQYGASVHTIQTVDQERDIAARNVARERLGLPPIERESRVPTTKAPDWASQKVWDLHEKMRRAREESSGLVETEFPTRVLRRNSTMSARRLLDGIGEYLGLADRSTLEGQKQVIDFWGRLSDESYRREPYTLPSIRESRGVNIEVAPDPRDQAAVDTFNAFPENVRAEITTEVAEPVIRDTMRNLEIEDYEVEYTLGGFQGGTQPSIIIRFGNAVPYNKMLEASKVLGTLWKQQAVIVYDEDDTQGGVQTQFVKVNPSRQLSYDETKDLFKRIYDRYPVAAGFTSREGSLVFGNFTDTPQQEFRDNIATVLTDIFQDLDYMADANSSVFRSDWIEPVNLEDTKYGQVSGLPGVEAGREDLRRQGEFDSLQARSDELFRAAVQKRTRAEAAPAEAALTPTARESRVPRSSVSIFEMPDEEAKQTLGLEPGKNITRLVGESLNQRTLDEFGKIEDTNTSDKAAKQIADAMVTEVLYQLQSTAQTGTGIGWYSNNYPRALERLANRFPELKTDPNARALFTAIVAITSNGEDVNQNISNAVTIYSEARKGRRLSELSVGTRRSDALQNNLEVLDDLVDRYGLEGFSKVLLEEMTVKDINAELRRLGQESNSAYTADTVMPRAALYFGPKLGAFYANLMGSEGYLTMDLWWSRMFNRLRGTLIPKPTQSSIDNIRKMLVDIGMLPPSWAQNIIVPTDDEVIEAAVPFWESAKNKKYKNTTALEKAANTLIKSARLELEEAPFRASDRSFMIRTTRLAQDQLRRRGVNLSLADIQAALWYYEKRLYGKLTGRATDDIGYEEAILRAAEGARPERSPARFFGGRGRGAVTEAAGETVGRVVPAEIQAVTPAAREARRRGKPIGPPQPGPVNNTDNTSAAEALNGGEPVDSIGTPIGPTISDTMPDGTVNVSGARIAPLTQRLVTQLIQSAPDKLRSGLGLDDLAKRIENYYDTYSSRLGVVNAIVRDAFNRIGFRDRNAALITFEQFIRARENGRIDEAQAILDQATDSERQLIDAWNEISLRTGEINTNLRTPEGKPMRVWDAKRGEWRPIRSVRNFFPRAFRREVMEVMRNPDLDPQLWRDLLDSLIAAGRADTIQDAENYLLREWFSDEIKQDYFSGVEKARNEPLPEIFYDYSWDAATRYMRKWARRTSQIENFGQTLGTFQKEWFDANIPKVRDPDTQNYLNSIKERIYEIEQFSALTNIANWANSLATATQLGNPISASLNLLGGTVTNVQEFGIKEIAKAYIELAKDWKNVQKEGTTLGILNKDFMNILNDHVEMDADKYFSKEQKVSQALAKFTNVMLTVGGFNGAENIVRSAAMLAARSRLNSFLNDVNDGQETKQVQAFREWVKRENLDIDALILEDGAGKETERFLRRAVNVPQGSYNIDMTPVFIDTAAGRFLLKYQKFGTQINRFFYNHFLKPFYDKPDPKNFMRIAGFLGTAVIGGGAIIAIREAFGYGDPGPDDEEIVKAFENEDTARAWGLIFSRAWQNIMTAGSLGFFANYAQFAKDWQDQQRVKNPFSPPGLASVDAVIDVFNRLRDQGKLTARDLDEIAEGTMSFYRANKRIALAGMDAIGVDAREVRRFAAQRDIREVREYGRRYSETMDIEFKQRTAPGRIVRTPMTPTNKAITDALQQGDSARARLLIRDAKEGLPFKEKQRVMASIRAAVRNRQPIQIGGNAPSQQERAEFMRWSRQNLPAEKYEMIRRLDRQYKRAATRAGVGFGD